MINEMKLVLYAMVLIVACVLFVTAATSWASPVRGICDDGTVVATDALAVLRNAVGLDGAPLCGARRSTRRAMRREGWVIGTDPVDGPGYCLPLHVGATQARWCAREY